jgi:hypothetical protein
MVPDMDNIAWDYLTYARNRLFTIDGGLYCAERFPDAAHAELWLLANAKRATII